MEDTVTDGDLGAVSTATEATDNQAPAGGDATPEGDQAQDQRNNQFLDPRVKNALGWRDQKLAKLKQERKEFLQREATYKAELEKYKAQNSAPKPPKEEDFQAYGDFLVEKAKFEILQSQKQDKSSDEPKQEAPQMSDQERLWRAQREQNFSVSVASLAKEIPDFAETMIAYADFAEDLPAHIQNMFLEAENGTLAFYNMAREGKLEALLGMSPYQAGLAIDAAQRKGGKTGQFQSAPMQQQAGQMPPKPIQGARGVSPGRSDDSLDGRELLKKYGLKK